MIFCGKNYILISFCKQENEIFILSDLKFDSLELKLEVQPPQDSSVVSERMNWRT